MSVVLYGPSSSCDTQYYINCVAAWHTFCVNVALFIGGSLWVCWGMAYLSVWTLLCLSEVPCESVAAWHTFLCERCSVYRRFPVSLINHIHVQYACLWCLHYLCGVLSVWNTYNFFNVLNIATPLLQLNKFDTNCAVLLYCFVNMCNILLIWLLDSLWSWTRQLSTTPSGSQGKSRIQLLNQSLIHLFLYAYTHIFRREVLVHLV